MYTSMFFQMISSAEPFRANGAGEWPQTRVDALVAGQFFIARKCLAAQFFVAFERSFT